MMCEGNSGMVEEWKHSVNIVNRMPHERDCDYGL
jgi:hypothetical protein